VIEGLRKGESVATIKREMVESRDKELLLIEVNTTKFNAA